MELKKNLNYQNYCDVYDKLAKYIDLLYPHKEYSSLSGIPDLLEESFRNNEEIKIIDLCCGTGRGLHIFKENKKFKLYGVDCSEKMLERAKQNIPNGNFEKCLLPDEDIPFKEKFHCAILVSATIQEFAPNDREKIYKKVWDLLYNGGYFICDVLSPEKEEYYALVKKVIKKDNETSIFIYYRESLSKEKARQHVFLIKKQPGKDWSLQHFVLEHFVLDIAGLSEELTRAGFSKLKIWPRDSGLIIARKYIQDLFIK